MDLKHLVDAIKKFVPTKYSSINEEKKGYKVEVETKDLEELTNELEKIKKVKKLLEMVPEEKHPFVFEELESQEVIKKPAYIQNEEGKEKNEEKVELEEIELEDNFTENIQPMEKEKEESTQSGEEDVEKEKLFKRMPSTENKEVKTKGGGKKMLKIGIPYIDDHIEPSLSIPKILSSSVDEKAEEEVRDILETQRSASNIDKSKLTQRILALTKEFLSEKDIRKKRQISEEIRKLKQSVALQSSKKVDVLKILAEKQQEEIKEIIEEIRDDVQTNVEACKKEYEQALLLAGNDPSLINRINEQFIKDLNTIESQLTSVIRKTLDFVKRLHLMELEKLVEKGDVSADKTEELYKSIENYEVLFNKLYVDLKGFIEKTRQAVKINVESSFEDENQESKSQNVEEIVHEINETREAVLLHTLRAKNRKAFLDYLKGTIPKEEALQIARRLLAKEMGLNDKEINKYFPI